MYKKSLYLLQSEFNISKTVALNTWFDSIYQEYNQILRDKGIKGVWNHRKELLLDIGKIEFEVSDKGGKLIDIKDIPSLIIFRDGLHKVRFDIKTFLIIKKIISFIINGAFIPVIVLSIYFLIRKLIIISSLLFSYTVTSVYLANNFIFFNHIRINLIAFKEFCRVFSLHIHNFIFNENVPLYPVKENKTLNIIVESINNTSIFSNYYHGVVNHIMITFIYIPLLEEL